MPARTMEMRKLLSTAIFDDGFRRKLIADSKAAAAGLGVELDAGQAAILKTAAERLGAADIEKFKNFDISAHKEVDFASGNPIDKVAFHGSTSISW